MNAKASGFSMLIKQKNSPYFYAVITVGKNRIQKFSLKTVILSEARYYHSQLYKKYFDIRKHDHIKMILDIPLLNEDKKICLNEAVTKVQELKDIAKDSLATFKRFLIWIRKNYPKIVFIDDIDKITALAFLRDNYSLSAPKSYNTVKSALSSFWKPLKMYCIENVWLSIPNKTTVDSKGYRSLTDNEVKRILDNSEGFWHYASLISYYTGLRKIDIFILKWSEIHDSYIELIPKKTKRYKKAVYIPLHSDLINLFNKLPRNSEYVFPDACKKYSSGTFHKQYKAILIQSGVMGASFHCLRSTFITKAESFGISREVLMGVVGHSSPHMTERYSHDKESAKKITEIPSILS